MDQVHASGFFQPRLHFAILHRGSSTTRVPNLWCFRSIGRHLGAPLLCKTVLPGPGAHASIPRVIVWLFSLGPRLPARRLRPPTAWSRRLPDPAEVDHRGRSPSPDDLVFSSPEDFGES